MTERFYKANIIAATLYGLASLFACSTFQLWLPHPVGHLFPAASAGAAAAWSIHCILLGVATGTRRWPRLLLNAAGPFLVSVAAMVACFERYVSQYSA